MKNVLVEVSARHIHVTQEVLEVLFGAGYQLTPKKELSQPGQYVCEEKVEVVGPRSSLKMSILGPTRKETQVEVSFTDARTLGVKCELRESGNIANTVGIKLVGPKGECEISEGVIVAKRHIHMTEEDAKEFNVTNGEIVSVKILTEGRSVTMHDTVIRVRNDFKLAMHIDTDEANAAMISTTAQGQIIK